MLIWQKQLRKSIGKKKKNEKNKNKMNPRRCVISNVMQTHMYNLIKIIIIIIVKQPPLVWLAEPAAVRDIILYRFLPHGRRKNLTLPPGYRAHTHTHTSWLGKSIILLRMCTWADSLHVTTNGRVEWSNHNAQPAATGFDESRPHVGGLRVSRRYPRLTINTLLPPLFGVQTQWLLYCCWEKCSMTVAMC